MLFCAGGLPTVPHALQDRIIKMTVALHPEMLVIIHQTTHSYTLENLILNHAENCNFQVHCTHLYTLPHLLKCFVSTKLHFAMLWSFPDSQCSLVVLCLQAHRILRHILLHLTEEREPADISTRIPPFHNVLIVVDRHQMGAQWVQ